MSIDVITGEVVTVPDALVPAATPAATLDHLVQKADVLARIIEQRNLYHVISGKKHVTVEGWQALAQLLGLTCLTLDTERIDGGWLATAEVRRTTDGMAVGRATAICTSEERMWAKRDDNHRLSMAQTRAQSKAIRSVAGVVTVLAGLEATPYEEMPSSPEPSPRAGAPSPSGRGHTSNGAPAHVCLDESQRRQVIGMTTERAIDDQMLAELMCKSVKAPAPQIAGEHAATVWVEKALERFPASAFDDLVALLERYGNPVEA